MSDLIDQDNEDIPLEVPLDLEGPNDIDLWYNEQGVAKANINYHSRMIDGNLDQINHAKRFRDQLVNGYHEANIGSSPKVRKLRESTINIYRNMQRVNDYLYLNQEGESIGEQSVDLGDERLNQMMILLQSRFNRVEEKFDKMDEKFDKMDEKFDKMDEKFDKMDEKFDKMDEKFDKMDERIDKLEKYQRSSSARFENKFRGKGGDSGQNAYLPIVNYENKLPSEENLDSLSSINQIHSFSHETINKYLGFYGLSTDGILPIKRVRLETYLGVNFEFKKQEGESI